MTALNKQALIAKIKKQTESFDTVVLKEDEANLLLDELEASQKLATQQGNIAVALLDEVTTLRRNANDNVPELRECLEAAEKRIAELEARTVTLPHTFWYEHDDLSRDIPVLDKRLVKKAIRAAGIKVEGE
ncbi:hypothetical protein EMN88_24070 [Salmonella enterica subsp. enterica serovar Bareilly]|nr:hypothetical protein [Salmonella enterica subsp. enterica serovar Bareilly]